MFPLKTLLFALAATTFLVALHTNATKHGSVEYLPSLAYLSADELHPAVALDHASDPAAPQLRLLSSIPATSGLDIKQLPSFEVDLGQDLSLFPERILSTGNRSIVQSAPGILDSTEAPYTLAAAIGQEGLLTTTLTSSESAQRHAPFEFSPQEAVVFGPFPGLTLPNGKEAYLIITSRIVEKDDASILAGSQ